MSKDRKSEVWYEDVQDMGFTIDISHDPVRERACGSGDYVIAEYELTSRYTITWDQDERACDIVKTNKGNDVLFKHRLNGRDEVKRIIELFREPATEKDAHPLAC